MARDMTFWQKSHGSLPDISAMRAWAVQKICHL
jgi:hypothetical protein